LLILLSFPLALIFGIVGIVVDLQKLLAVICTLIAGAFVLFYLYVVGLHTFCR